MEIESLPEPLRKLVHEELAAGERVRWVGQPTPRPGRLLKASLLPMAMGVPAIAFMLYWMGSAAGLFDHRGDDGPFRIGRYVFAALGLPGLLFGVAMLASPLWLPGRVRVVARRTAYVITDKRAIVFDGGYRSDSDTNGVLLSVVRSRGRGTTIRSYSPEQIAEIERSQQEDGSGDVFFHEADDPPEEEEEHTTFLREGFFSVQDVKEVEDRLRELAKGGSERSQG